MTQSGKGAPVVSLWQLQRGYELSIDNAIRCLGASWNLVREYPDKALGLAQLGQEEIGRSLSLLAAGALPSDPAAWSWLWDGWRDHQLKAHRAYLYEIFHPFRLGVPHPSGGEVYDGLPLLDRLSAEKEISFYVDFDRELNTFLAPEELVDKFAATARASTLLYLSATADAIRRTLKSEDYDFRFREFSRLAFKVCSEQVYQQDWPAMRDRFAGESLEHEAIISDLGVAFKSTTDYFKDAVARKPERKLGDDV